MPDYFFLPSKTFRESLSFPFFGSRPINLTSISSPSFKPVSSMFSNRLLSISEMWSRPSLPGRISTKGSERYDRLDLTFIDLSDFGNGYNSFDASQSGIKSLLVFSEDINIPFLVLLRNGNRRSGSFFVSPGSLYRPGRLQLR